MKTPPLLIGAALLFWGWQTDLLFWAALMTIVVEASHVVRARWELSRTELNRVWELCCLLIVATALILYNAEDNSNIAFTFAQWQPFLWFPMMLAQSYGSMERMPLSVFSWFLRRSPDNPLAKKKLNVSFPYFAICLLAASATNRGHPLFYPGMVLLMGAGLAAVRPRRLSFGAWLLLFGLLAASAHFGHHGFRKAQPAVETAVGNWLMHIFRREPDHRESRTSIGRIGRIKLSGKIVLRVQPEEGAPPPGLLREASYDSYRRGVWSATQSEFFTATVDTNDVAHLLPPKRLSSSVRIATSLPRGRGLLPLPHGAFELHDLPVALETNLFGVAKVIAGPGLVNFVAHYGPGASFDSPPQESDFEVSERDFFVFAQITRELELESKTEAEKIRAIARFFEDHFTYSLYTPWVPRDRWREKTPLARFLTETRSGHCEYFATATVFLLRQAGIPARYATGYAVQEDSRNGKMYLVRERHAHAWVLVYRQDKQRWENFDTTPAIWGDVEDARASFWQPVSDFWSRIKFEFSKWRWSKTNYSRHLVWLLIPLTLTLAWRIIFATRRRQRRAEQKTTRRTWPGADSEFYRIERRLAAAGLGRLPEEPLPHWNARHRLSLPEAESLEFILRLHNRLRFDPDGLTAEERQRLKQEVDRWLTRFEKHPPPLSVQ